MKILITGGSGLLGSNLLYYFQTKPYTIFYTLKTHRIRVKGVAIKTDLVNEFAAVEKSKYDVIINTVALTDVDACEKDPQSSFKLNTEIPEKLAKYCLKTNCHLIHISTDQIFDGEKGNYTEESIPKPINIYGKTKYEAEKRIQSILPREKYTILRTNFFGINCINKLSFSEWILDCLTNKKEIRMFYDVYFNPLLVNTLAGIIETSIQKKLRGVYHCTSDRKISKYDFGMMVKSIFGLDHPIERISLSEMQFTAKRPKNMYLDNTKIKAALHSKEFPIGDEITKLYNLYEEKYPQKLKKHYVPEE